MYNRLILYLDTLFKLSISKTKDIQHNIVVLLGLDNRTSRYIKPSTRLHRAEDSEILNHKKSFIFTYLHTIVIELAETTQKNSKNIVKLFISFRYILFIVIFIFSSNLSPHSPTWIGCWWIGFLLCGFLAILISLIIFCMPKELKGQF